MSHALDGQCENLADAHQRKAAKTLQQAFGDLGANKFALVLTANDGSQQFG